MTAIDRTAYPRLAVQLSKKEVEAFYAPNPEEIAFVSGQGRGPSTRLTQMVLLKTFQHLGYFPALRDIPESIIKYLRKVLELEPDIQIKLEAPRSLYRHHTAIREFLNICPYGDEAEARRLSLKTPSSKPCKPCTIPPI